MLIQWQRFVENLGPSAIAAAAALPLLAAVVHLTLRWWIGRRARGEEPPSTAEATGARRRTWWSVRGLREMWPPLALLIWIHAFYASARLLSADSPFAWTTW